jgi:CRISPR-associated DxTHG motif protein
MSFLGTGDYHETIYEYKNRLSSTTKFIQTAEFELLGKDCPNYAYILVTQQSKSMHFADLTDELAQFGVIPNAIKIDEDMSSEGQWKWFETILEVIHSQDQLIIDLTHGYRSVPIIFSAALNFLQKTRNVELLHVFYGAYEQRKECPPIIDMRKFYDINIWTDGVNRLTEEADARPLALAAQKSHAQQLPELSDKGLIEAFQKITERIRNVDVNNVGVEANNVLAHIKRVRESEQSSSTGRLLLQIAEKKFKALERENLTNKGLYQNHYFEHQLEIIKLLLQHALYMQAFTAMREFLISIADMFAKQRLEELFLDEWQKKPGKKKKKYRKESRRRFAESFPAMLSIPEEKWDFHSHVDSKGENFIKVMEPVFRDKQNRVLLKKMSDLFKSLKEYRNGFDHAWTGKVEMKHDINEKGWGFFQELEEIMEHLSF